MNDDPFSLESLKAGDVVAVRRSGHPGPWHSLAVVDGVHGDLVEVGRKFYRRSDGEPRDRNDGQIVKITPEIRKEWERRVLVSRLNGREDSRTGKTHWHDMPLPVLRRLAEILAEFEPAVVDGLYASWLAQADKALEAMP